MPSNYSNNNTRAPKGSKVYKEYFQGREILESDAVYQTKLSRINIDRVVRSLFAVYNIRPTKISTNSSSKDVYRVFEPTTNTTIYINCHLVKNSGITKSSGQTLDRKRLQIHINYYGLIKNNEIRPENELYFFLGIYPSGDPDDPIIVLLDNDGVSLNPQDSYSSLWINFNAIKTAYNQGIYYAINKNNWNKYVCFRKQRWPLVWQAFIQGNYEGIISNTHINVVNAEGTEVEFQNNVVDDYIPSRDAIVTRTGNSKVKRNGALREICFDNANYTCEACHRKETFVGRDGHMFFEGHHLIPCNMHNQINFTKKLDSTANLYCLCTECHEKIHHGSAETVKQIITDLYNQRKDIYENVYNCTLDQLIAIYMSEFREDDPE